MGYEDKIAEYLSITDSIPAVAQGAIGIESRDDDLKTNSLLSFLDHPETRVVVECERAFLAKLEGGCQVPIAGHAEITEQKINFTGLVGSVDGSQMFRHSEEASSCHRVEMGVKTAEKLLDMGGRKILEELYNSDIQD
jgi:hydroxymethylbilane synthase